jgi:hypothetical protein
VETNTEDTYNKMNEAMVQFETRLFRKDHKSYYSTEDINILDEYRTVANAGLLEKLPKRSELVEIDVSKAYTRAFMNIEQIPVFNEFDVWETYDQEKIKDDYLYIVEVSKFNLFFNKKINLCYGYFLKKFLDLNYPLTIKTVKNQVLQKK